MYLVIGSLKFWKNFKCEKCLNGQLPVVTSDIVGSEYHCCWPGIRRYILLPKGIC